MAKIEHVQGEIEKYIIPMIRGLESKIDHYNKEVMTEFKSFNSKMDTYAETLGKHAVEIQALKEGTSTKLSRRADIKALRGTIMFWIGIGLSVMTAIKFFWPLFGV